MRSYARLASSLAILSLAGLLVAAPAHAAAGDPASVVDDYNYPGADQILAEHGVKILKGDGGIRFVADCQLRPNVLRVERLDGFQFQYICFEVRGPRGFVKVEIPNLVAIRGADRPVQATADQDGVVTTATVPVNAYASGWSLDPDLSAVLLELRVNDSLPAGSPSPRPYVAKVTVGDRGCSGVLVHKWWVLTAKTCFSGDGNVGAVPAGTKVVVGRADLNQSGGADRTIARLVARTDRDVVMAKLDTPVNDIAPVAVATPAPAAGATVVAAGYGQTAADWGATTLRSLNMSVSAVSAGRLELTRAAGTATSTCEGDAGGPTLQVAGDVTELVAVHTASHQAGCFGVSATTDTAVETRIDDIAGWIKDVVKVPAGDYDGDGMWDLLAMDTTGDAMYFMRNVSGADGPNLAAKQRMNTGWRTVGRHWLVDWDNDGYDDIVGLNGTDEMYGWRNTTVFPDASNGGLQSLGTGWSTVVDPVFGDFTGDGKVDIAAWDAATHDSLWVIPNTSQGQTLSRGNSIRVGGGWRTVRTISSVDWDGDGKRDLVGLNGTDQLLVWRNTSSNGVPSFGAPQSLGTAWSTVTDFVFGDFTADGKIDVAARDTATRDQLWVIPNTSSGTTLSRGDSFLLISGGWAATTWSAVMTNDQIAGGALLALQGDKMRIIPGLGLTHTQEFRPPIYIGTAWNEFSRILPRA